MELDLRPQLSSRLAFEQIKSHPSDGGCAICLVFLTSGKQGARGGHVWVCVDDVRVRTPVGTHPENTL